MACGSLLGRRSRGCGDFLITEAARCPLRESEACPFEIFAKEVVVGQHVSRAALQELDEILAIDHAGEVRRDSPGAEAGRSAGNDERAPVAIQGKPLGP